jgi:hypothetical protein
MLLILAAFLGIDNAPCSDADRRLDHVNAVSL